MSDRFDLKAVYVSVCYNVLAQVPNSKHTSKLKVKKKKGRVAFLKYVGR